MNLAVFGGSGRVGTAVLRLATTRGWTVRALVRPSSQCREETGIKIIRGSLDSSSDVLMTLHGAHAVLCLYGPRSAQSNPFCARATRRVIAEMQVIGVRRLLCLTGAMVGVLPSNVSLALRAMAVTYRYWCPELAADASEQERVVIESQLDWTLVKPPRLTNSAATDLTRSGPAVHVGLLSHISRDDLATFLLDEARDSQYVQKRVYICNRANYEPFGRQVA
ncbi:MAG: NAD(P)H-binding protein [Nitrospira sp.]|nr:NAD(P)H-binding protein [Nitrospira sp.]